MVDDSMQTDSPGLSKQILHYAKVSRYTLLSLSTSALQLTLVLSAMKERQIVHCITAVSAAIIFAEPAFYSRNYSNVF